LIEANVLPLSQTANTKPNRQISNKPKQKPLVIRELDSKTTRYIATATVGNRTVYCAIHDFCEFFTSRNSPYFTNLWLQTSTSETLSRHPRAAVHRSAAIFEFVRAFDHILLP